MGAFSVQAAPRRWDATPRSSGSTWASLLPSARAARSFPTRLSGQTEGLLAFGRRGHKTLNPQVRRAAQRMGTARLFRPCATNGPMASAAAFDIIRGGNEFAFAQTAAEGFAKADPYPRLGPDGHGLAVEPSGTEGDDKPGDR